MATSSSPEKVQASASEQHKEGGHGSKHEPAAREQNTMSSTGLGGAGSTMPAGGASSTMPASTAHLSKTLTTQTKIYAKISMFMCKAIFVYIKA